MRVQLFGEYLQDQGIIDARQLRESIELMFYVNRSIGEIATQLGYLNQTDVDRVCRAQAVGDALFGEIAIEMNLLSLDQVHELVAHQESRQVRLGQALVELGHLDEDGCKLHLDAFEASQARFQPQNRVLPDELVSPGLARLVLEQIPKQTLRTALIPLRIGAAEAFDEAPVSPHVATVEIHCGGQVIVAALLAPESLASALDPPGLDAFMGQVAAGLRSRLSTGPTSAGFETTSGSTPPSTGWCFEFSSTHGRGWILLANA